jgi:seryl-tRNA synthetase
VDVDRLVTVDAELRQAIARSDELRAQQKRQGKSREQVDIDAARALKDELRTVTEEVRTLQVVRDDLWARVPNLLPYDTLAGTTTAATLNGAARATRFPLMNGTATLPTPPSSSLSGS